MSIYLGVFMYMCALRLFSTSLFTLCECSKESFSLVFILILCGQTSRISIQTDLYHQTVAELFLLPPSRTGFAITDWILFVAWQHQFVEHSPSESHGICSVFLFFFFNTAQPKQSFLDGILWRMLHFCQDISQTNECKKRTNTAPRPVLHHNNQNVLPAVTDKKGKNLKKIRFYNLYDCIVPT